MYEGSRHSRQILMTVERSRLIFEKHSNIKLHENPFSASRVVPCGRTHRHDENNVALRSFANASKNGFKRAKSNGDNTGRQYIGVFVSRYQHITKTGTSSL
jgi:hypothetical protein